MFNMTFLVTNREDLPVLDFQGYLQLSATGYH